MTRILVTGAAGYVGRQVMDALRAGGNDVHGATRHDADLLDRDSVDRLLAAVRPTHLIHLAWVTAHGAFWADPANDRWLEAGVALVESFIRLGGRRAITVGSGAEYTWDGDAPLSEARTPGRPASHYGHAKLALCVNAARLCRQSGVSHAHARLFFSYGPHEKRARLVPSVILALLAGRPIELSNPDSIRDYLDVRDVGRALAMLATSDVEGPINLAAGTGVSIKAMAEAIAGITGHGEMVSFRPSDLPTPKRSRFGFAQAGASDSVVADAGRLSRELGFRPAIDLGAGLAHAVRWWQQAEPSPYPSPTKC